jgi:hypothetical protein
MRTIEFVGLQIMLVIMGGVIHAGVAAWRRGRPDNLPGPVPHTGLEPEPTRAAGRAGEPHQRRDIRVYDALRDRTHTNAGLVPGDQRIPGSQLERPGDWESPAEEIGRLEGRLEVLYAAERENCRQWSDALAAELARSSRAVQEYISSGVLAVPDWLPDYPTHELEAVR